MDQEACALLVTCQALRTAIADAASIVPGTDPDRASFTIALNAARDHVILAAGVIPGTVTDLAGAIGRNVLARLMPSRRLRVSPRVVKRAISKYNARGKVDRTTCKATIAVTIIAAPLTGDGDDNYPALGIARAGQVLAGQQSPAAWLLMDRRGHRRSR